MPKVLFLVLEAFDEASRSSYVRSGMADGRLLTELSFARLLHVFYIVVLWRRRLRERSRGKPCSLCRWFAGGKGLPPVADIN